MARIRTIKPDFWTDEEVVELDPLDRLLFIGLWNFCDDQGFLDYRPKKIKMQVLPADDVDVPSALARLARASLVVAYQGPEGVVLHIRNWAKHQRVSNAARERYNTADLQVLPDWHTTLASPRDSYPAEGKGREGKGREGTALRASTPPVQGDVTNAREEFGNELETTSPQTVFPRSWTPKTRHQAYALEHNLDVRHETQMFTEHARANGRTAVDWDAAFMTWLGRAKPRGKGGRRTTDEKVHAGLTLAQRLAAEEQADDTPQIGA